MFNYFHCNDHHFTVDRDVRSQNQTFRRQPYELRESDHPALAAPGSQYATSLRKLASGQCRWVLSTPPDKTIYCGAPTNGGSWCAWHRRIVYAEPAAARTPPG